MHFEEIRKSDADQNSDPKKRKHSERERDHPITETSLVAVGSVGDSDARSHLGED